MPFDLSLVHHYRVFRRGLPQFVTDYMERLRVFILQVSALQQYTLPSPVPGSSVPVGNPRLGDGETGSPKKAWRIQGRKRETRVREEPVCEQSKLKVVQDVRDWQVLSCTTAGHPFYRFQSHCGTYVVRQQIGRLHLPVWLPPPWK